MFNRYSVTTVIAGIILGLSPMYGNSYLFPVSTKESGDPLLVFSLLGSLIVGTLIRQIVHTKNASITVSMVIGFCLPYIIVGGIMNSTGSIIGQAACLIAAYLISPIALANEEENIKAQSRRVIQ